MDKSEMIVEDPKTGGRKGSKLARFDLIPPDSLFNLAEVYGHGCSKYAPRNWELGYAWGLSFAAMMRHAWHFWRGRYIDPESGLPHLAHVAWHAFTLMEFVRREIGTDDRDL